MTIDQLKPRRLRAVLIYRQRFRALPLRARAAVSFMTLVTVIGVFANLATRYNPLLTYTPVLAPSGRYWFGTDILGRDIFSRLILGTRDSLIIGFGSTVLALVVAIVLGSIAATSSKVIDEGIMRACDVVMTFPGIALASVLVTAFGNGLVVLVCTIAFLYLPILTRVVRANVMAQYSEDYVRAETVIGAGKLHILRRHVAVNCAAPVLVVCTLMVANAIVFEASLSFIGAGVQPPAPSWGNILASGRNLIIAGGWWATLFPGILLLLTVLSLNILAENISDFRSRPRKSLGEDDVAIVATAVERTIEVADVSLALVVAGQRLAARARPMPSGAPLLEVEDLTVRFPALHAGKAVVDSVSFDIKPGEVLGVAGESGCGKTLLGLAIIGLTPRSCEITGRIRYRGTEVSAMGRARRSLLGHEISMVYQDALSSLNPSMTIKAQLSQVVRRGGTDSPTDLLEMVGLDASRTLRSYPHELSGGQRQRVLIAMSLSRRPKLLLADEPTTALDVTVQGQVMDLLLRLRAERGFALMMVSHDLALLADVSDRLLIMYGGQLVEMGPTHTLVGSAAHHYTRGLLGAVVSIDSTGSRFAEIAGNVPSPADFVDGCRFSGRCPVASSICLSTKPARAALGQSHEVACHHPVLMAGAAAGSGPSKMNSEVGL